MKKKLLGAALVTTGLMAGCDTLYHDNDTLMVHGFIVPVGQTILGNPRKDANPADAAAPEDRISASKHIVDDNPDDVLLLTLRGEGEGDIIARQTIKKPDAWPTAYQLKFNPPAVDGHKDLWLDLRTTDGGKPLLIYSRQIELGTAVLFNTERDIIVTEDEKNPASLPNDDLQRHTEDKSYVSDAHAKISSSVLFETFKCSNSADDKNYNREVNIYIAENFIVLDNPRKVLPRLSGTPVTEYRAAQWQVEFTPDYTAFQYMIPGHRTLTCLVNVGTYLPSVKLDKDVERAPPPGADKSNRV